MNLDTLAFNNLKQFILLKDGDKIKYNGASISIIDKETQSDGAVNIRDIDLIIYFTFNQLLFNLNDKYQKLKDKIKIISYIEISLANIYNHIDIDEDKDSKIFSILNQIEDSLSLSKVKYIDSFWYYYYSSRDYILNPIYSLVDDITESYMKNYNMYNYIFYKDNLESLNTILNESSESHESNNSSDESDESDDSSSMFVNAEQIDTKELCKDYQEKNEKEETEKSWISSIFY